MLTLETICLQRETDKKQTNRNKVNQAATDGLGW